MFNNDVGIAAALHLKKYLAWKAKGDNTSKKNGVAADTDEKETFLQILNDDFGGWSDDDFAPIPLNRECSFNSFVNVFLT